jgi:hypothetical protein
MNVVLIFPVTNNSDKIPEIMKEFSNNIAPKLSILGAEEVEIKFAGTDYIFVGTNQTLKGKPKGQGILESLKNCAKEPEIVIVCDGSNAIPYINIINIFQEIISDSEMCCVMANRIKNKAISEERFLIEQFEVFIIKKYFNHNGEIKDGQCGLWAYRNPKLLCNNGQIKKINLTASSYEIEIDLLSEVLEKRLEYSFVDIELPQRTSTSSFKYENNLIKMRFLLNKYSKLTEFLLNYLTEFERINEEVLKKEEIKKIWENYKKDILSIE